MEHTVKRLNAQIMGTRENRLAEAILKSTNNLFWRKKCKPLYTQVYTGQTFNVYFFLVQVYIFDTNRVIQTQALKDIKLRKLVKQNVCNVGIRPKIYENLLTVTKHLISKLKFEPPHQKPNNLHIKRKQRRRSAQVFRAFLFSLHG